MEVRYSVYNREKGGKLSAENVSIIERGSLPKHEALERDIYNNGKVVRPLRSVNPDQEDYAGKIQTKDDDGTGEDWAFNGWRLFRKITLAVQE